MDESGKDDLSVRDRLPRLLPLCLPGQSPSLPQAAGQDWQCP
jgi:hypothetical protein